MKTIIAGSRHFHDRELLHSTLANLPYQISEVVSGAASGADRLGEEWAISQGLPVRRFPAEWHRGKWAGPSRNTAMAEYAEALVAFHQNNSSGTRDMIDKARKRGLHVTVIAC